MTPAAAPAIPAQPALTDKPAGPPRFPARQPRSRTSPRRFNNFRRHSLETFPGIALASMRAHASLKEASMTIKIVPYDKGNPPGKLADAELHFTSGPLEGLKLIGFGIWERKTGAGRNVTFPARQYSVNGERRSFALLRPAGEAHAQDRIRDLVLQAYAEYEAEAAVAS
jgi:hypothetical protein